MAARFGLFALILLLGTRLEPEVRSELIVWNIGQGQWVTVVDATACWHFDMGGEHAPWKAIIKLCHDRPNRISLSHWDWDHISFTIRAHGQLPNVCLLLPPVGSSTSKKEHAVLAIKPCQIRPPFEHWVDENGETANDKSRVVWWKGILIPGDSTIKEEKHWIHQLPHLRETRILVLGHHGSQTSTSRLLLDQLPLLNSAIASARQKKYGHPHLRVQRDLRLYRAPLLRTEEWGTLHFEY